MNWQDKKSYGDWKELSDIYFLIAGHFGLRRRPRTNYRSGTWKRVKLAIPLTGTLILVEGRITRRPYAPRLSQTHTGPDKLDVYQYYHRRILASGKTSRPNFAGQCLLIRKSKTIIPNYLKLLCPTTGHCRHYITCKTGN